MFYPVRPPTLLKRYYNSFTWEKPSEENEVFLTFDDGPTPGVTDFVLDTLRSFNARATFFCIGNNVQQHPDLYNRILVEGHRVGNHTYNHLNGWLHPTEQYVSDVHKASHLIDSNLFRPPYGRIRKQQSEIILKTYQIIMWDVLSYDFKTTLTPQKCLSNVLNNYKPGSIIVFHDSIKASVNMKYTLPKFLEALAKKDFTFSAIH